MSTKALKWLDKYSHETGHLYPSSEVSFVQKVFALARHIHTRGSTEGGKLSTEEDEIKELTLVCIGSLRTRIELLEKGEYSNEIKKKAHHAIFMAAKRISENRKISMDDIRIVLMRLIEIDRLLGLRSSLSISTK